MRGGEVPRLDIDQVTGNPLRYDVAVESCRPAGAEGTIQHFPFETAEHLVILRSLGCEYGQGYFFAKPLAPDEVGTLLASARRW